MLLVLFNAALSNLVLFRNNFALGRDVTHMFTVRYPPGRLAVAERVPQSFQASTHLFDPASNPNLFQGTLAIIIKVRGHYTAYRPAVN